MNLLSILGKNVGAAIPPPPVIVEREADPVIPDPERLKKPLNERYKGVVFQGSVFPDDPHQISRVILNDTMKKYYLPSLEKISESKGLRLLMTAMTHQEGFTPKSRSFRTNNPGNVGNTDSGANKKFKTLEDGIRAQAHHLKDIADGAKHYPLGSKIYLPPFYSKEIANNPKYGLPAHLPGYRFTYTGQLDQFLKIYSTGARATNNYVDTVVNYFRQNGVKITPQHTIAEIISL